jgi:hypothetical protein
MQILNWIPPHAQQIRYIASIYEEDNEGDRYCINEDEATSVWHDIIKQVHKTKRPMYYRRRTIDMARRDRYQWQRSIYNENDWKNDWAKSLHVRVKIIGKRVLFIYDEEFVHKNWIANKNKTKLQDKIRKLKEQKFKSYSKKILKVDDTVPSELDMDALDDLITGWTESSEALNEGR